MYLRSQNLVVILGNFQFPSQMRYKINRTLEPTMILTSLDRKVIKKRKIRQKKKNNFNSMMSYVKILGLIQFSIFLPNLETMRSITQKPIT